MYREDYARAGYLILPNNGREQSVMAWLTLAPSIALLLVSLIAAATDSDNIFRSLANSDSGLSPSLLWRPPGSFAVENRRASIAESLHRLSTVGIPDAGAWKTLRESTDLRSWLRPRIDVRERTGQDPIAEPGERSGAHNHTPRVTASRHRCPRNGVPKSKFRTMYLTNNSCPMVCRLHLSFSLDDRISSNSRSVSFKGDEMNVLWSDDRR